MTAARRRSGEDGPGAGAGGATLRGAVLIAVAVIIGVVLLGKGFDTGILGSDGETPSEEASNGDGNGEEGNGDDGTTTTVPPPTTHAPAQVRVVILNGAGTAGIAAGATETVGTAGFQTLPAENTAPVPAGVVYYAPTFDADAAAIAALLGIAAPPQPLPATPVEGAPAAGTVDVIAVLGPDFTPAG